MILGFDIRNLKNQGGQIGDFIAQIGNLGDILNLC